MNSPHVEMFVELGAWVVDLSVLCHDSYNFRGAHNPLVDA